MDGWYNFFPYLCVLQTCAANGGNYGRKGEQNHHLCGDQETLWWTDEKDAKGWVSNITARLTIYRYDVKRRIPRAWNGLKSTECMNLEIIPVGMVDWLARTPHRAKVRGFNSGSGLQVWSLHVSPPLPVWVFSRLQIMVLHCDCPSSCVLFLFAKWLK